jgi:SAM-dependent methyltransferase
MAARRKPPLRAERLRASPNFALGFALDGRAYVAKDSEPYVQYWLTERYRVLLSLFGGRRGATEAEAVAAWFRLTQAPDTEATRRGLDRAIRDMRGAGVLIGAGDDTSRYDAAIVADYVTHRPFPAEIAEAIVREGGIGAESPVLDLAGGPGDLALALARASGAVSMMELSAGFVAAARDRAAALGLKLEALHDSCNRLVYLDGAFDVVTVSQALHWLDDVMVCRGVCRLLRPGGSFFVVHAAFDVPDDHPLAFLLGRGSVLGQKVRQGFATEVQPLLRRLSLLFEALDAPDVDRADLGRHAVAAGGAVERIGAESVTFFRQRRPMGEGFARAFLTPAHVAVSGKAPDAFWADVRARCAAVPAERRMGTFDWALLRFRRGAEHPVLPGLETLPVVDIGYGGPADS